VEAVVVSPDLILSLVFAMLILAMAFSHGSWKRIEREPVELKPVPFTQPLGIEPTDPMVLCPRCRCMGHHSLELVPAKPPAPVHSFTDPSGNRVDVFTWQSAAGTAEHYRRECVFCGHTWSVPA
jgi:hypothetical protein